MVLPFAYDFGFLFTDGLAIIRQETLQNIFVAGGTVFFVILILLGFNVVAALAVLLMLVLVDVNLIGFMYYTNLDFNSVTAINLVIAVGLAVDASIHIVHVFLKAQGTRDERATKALKVGSSAAEHGV